MRNYQPDGVARPRVHHIDSLRAYAILMMLQGHFIYSLLAPAYRLPNAPLYAWWFYCKGFTAPIFFTVTGLVLVYLLLRRPEWEYRKKRLDRTWRRGLYLLFWGYLLRLNVIGLCIGEVYANFWLIDVLHCIGIALLATALAFWLTRKLPPWVFQVFLAIGGILIFLLEPLCKGWAGENLPVFIRNYLTNDYGSVFTPLPWLGYTLLGGFLGTLYHRWMETNWRGIPILGLLLVSVGWLVMQYSSPLFMAIHHQTGIGLFKQVAYNNYLFIRFGQILMFVAVFMALEPVLARCKLFNRIGQETLNIYIVHFVVLYGSWFGWGLARIWAESLSPWAAVTGAVLFMVAVAFLALRVHVFREFLSRLRAQVFPAKSRKWKKLGFTK